MVSYIKKMLFVQVKKIDIFMLLKKHKYRAGLALYHDIVEHIQSKACINIEFDDDLKAKIKSFIVYMIRSWKSVFKNTTRRQAFLIKYQIDSFMFKVKPAIVKEVNNIVNIFRNFNIYLKFVFISD